MGQALDTIENPLISEIPWTDCIIFTPNVGEILNYFCHWKFFFRKNTIELYFKVMFTLGQVIHATLFRVKYWTWQAGFTKDGRLIVHRWIQLANGHHVALQSWHPKPTIKWSFAHVHSHTSFPSICHWWYLRRKVGALHKMWANCWGDNRGWTCILGMPPSKGNTIHKAQPSRLA